VNDINSYIMSTNVYEKGLIHQNTSAVAYEALTFTDGFYTPTVGTVFAGLYIAPGTANAGIEIEGVDGETVILTLSPGVWPLGGQRIVDSGTTIDTTKVTVLF
jgi:hypothetical protein